MQKLRHLLNMKKVIILFFIGLVFIPLKVFSQEDSDGICNCYLPLDTTFKVVPMTLGADTNAKAPNYYNDINTSQAIRLPFNFCFYGTSYDTVYIGNKGIISFIKPIFNFTNGNLPAGHDTAMIAPFWSDIDDIPFGTIPPAIHRLIWYKMYPTRLVVMWNTVGYYTFDDDVYNSFQLTITNGSDPTIPGGNNVQFCYQPGGMGWTSADSSGGSMGFNGVPATVGVNKGDKISYAVISRFKLPGLTYYGPTSAINGLYWLNGKSLILNTCITDKNIPPVIINSNQCDTFNLCRFDSLQYTATFLCAEQGQRATLSVTSDTFNNIRIDTSSSANSIYTANITVNSGSAPLGYHNVNIKATDNSTPPQTSTYTLVINVGVCTGIDEVYNNDNKFSIYPNANPGRFIVQLDNGQSPENTEAMVYDVLGKLVYATKLNKSKTEIDISSRAKGMYFLKIYEGSLQMGVKKIVIQ